jgi:hypothetical protein
LLIGGKGFSKLDTPSALAELMTLFGFLSEALIASVFRLVILKGF